MLLQSMDFMESLNLTSGRTRAHVMCTHFPLSDGLIGPPRKLHKLHSCRKNIINCLVENPKLQDASIMKGVGDTYGCVLVGEAAVALPWQCHI